MTLSRALWYYLWLAPHALQIALLVVMLGRGMRRQFPMFLLYTAFEVVQFSLLFTLYQLHIQFDGAYARMYFVGLAISTALRFAVIREIFNQLFKSYAVLQKPASALFRGTSLVLLVVALWLAATAPGDTADLLMYATNAMDRTVTILQCGLLLLLFLLSNYLTLPWRSRVFGIALGLGIYASISLAVSAVRFYSGASNTFVFDLIVMGAYHGCVVVWLYYLALPEREPKLDANVWAHHDLETWNQELERLLQHQ
ncbi:MAG: hypothetical protein JST79_21180 [Acidobacteria bacterium]|jgi:hypothetical protein|nr:hypothetical protein [Acidobacteriota bacterium]